MIMLSIALSKRCPRDKRGRTTSPNEQAEYHVSKHFYRPELDALRFLAFFLVYVSHTTASMVDQMATAGPAQAVIADISIGGSYGVDLFFLLSAYLITELLTREMNRTGTIDVPSFYMRRILRIWPLYFSYTLITLILSHFTPVQFPADAVMPMFFFYLNWYFVTHAVFSPGSILWSVSVEEQFYVLCPIFIRALSKRNLMRLCVGLIILANVVRFVVLKNSDNWWHSIWFNTFTRLDPIATGILISLVLGGTAPRVGVVTRSALATAGLLLLYLADKADGIRPPSFIGWMAAFPMVDLGVLAIFLAFLGASISWRPLIYLGQISYGLYVFHMFWLDAVKVVLLRFTGECSFWERGLISLPLTIAVAAVSYRWLETPFLRLKGISAGELLGRVLAAVRIRGAEPARPFRKPKDFHVALQVSRDLLSSQKSGPFADEKIR
jgi:peptidoglycan/LPS O-acetylase OafA/YrhL